MKLLHTSDWHVGKTLKGRNRLDEQRQVLAEIVGVAARAPGRRGPDRRRPLRHRPRPSAEAQQLVVQALLALARHRRARSSPSPATTTAQPLSTPTGR